MEKDQNTPTVIPSSSAHQEGIGTFAFAVPHVQIDEKPLCTHEMHANPTILPPQWGDHSFRSACENFMQCGCAVLWWCELGSSVTDGASCELDQGILHRVSCCNHALNCIIPCGLNGPTLQILLKICQKPTVSFVLMKAHADSNLMFVCFESLP